LSEENETTGVVDETTGVDSENEENKTTGVVDKTTGVDSTADMEERYGPQTGPQNLCPRRKPNEKYCKAIRPQDHSRRHATLEHYAMTQYSVKKGLEVYGEAGKVAVSSKMQHFHDMGVVEPKKVNMLTHEERSKALNYLMFLKQKRCGRIKGRGCADGRKQRLYKTKEETSAPTVAIESLFLTCTIDAKERRTVTTTDIPGAFMQTDIDEVIHVRLEGPLATLLA
jgi:hypothetical protein